MQNYESVAYAKERVVGTIVRVKGNAASIIEISKTVVSYVRLVDGNVAAAPIKDLDISPVPLGYCNTNLVCPFIMRAPARQWKQGINLRQLRYSWHENIAKFNVDGWMLSDLGRTIDDLFPSYTEAYNNVKQQVVIEQAFDRNFAIAKNLDIFYKGMYRVGHCDDDMNCTIFDESEWIRDQLEIVLAK